MKLFIPIATTVILLSCSKKSENDRVPPVITINSPVNNQQFNRSETVLISASVSDDALLESVQLSQTDSTTMTIDPASATFLYPAVTNINAAAYEFSLALRVWPHYKTSWRFVLTATDKGGNKTSGVVKVSIN